MTTPPPILLLLLTTLLITTTIADPTLLSDLQSLRARSPSGVIHLSDTLLRRITTSPTPRPFSVTIFFDALQLHDKSDLHLKQLKHEFHLLSSSFLTNHPPPSPSLNKLFFCDIEFSQSQSSFAQFGVNALPHLRLVPPNARTPSESLPMDASDFSGLADSMSHFIESKTNIPIGPIHRPPLLSKTQLVILSALFLISLPFLIKKVLAGETLFHDKRVWLSGSVFVYFFSVSGTMHNIIRKMPMFISDRSDPNKMVFFYQGSGMQLGAEGFAIGFLYTVVGLLLAFVTHVLVRVRSSVVQRVFMIVAMVVSVWAVRKVVYLDNWKTGYAVHAYLPSSW